jgi:hypothetical protein
MTAITGIWMKVFKTLTLFSVAVVFIIRGGAEAREDSPGQLIGFLSHRSATPEEIEHLAIFSCGQAVADRDAARSLVKFGNSAIPELEKELDTIEKRGTRLGDGSPWLELSYARIRGPVAFARLHRMEGDPKNGINRENMDSSIALAQCGGSIDLRLGEK